MKEDSLLIQTILYSHIGAGAVSLVVAPIALVVHKGGKAHRLWGKVFFWCMTWVFVTAVLLSIFKWIPFLLMIAVFSYYSVFIAYRSIYQKQLHLGKGVHWYDWLALMISGGFNLFFIGYGAYYAFVAGGGLFAYLSIGFGIGGALQARSQLRWFLHASSPHAWLYHHSGNMIGGFIASLTAFSTQVLFFMPEALKWIWPSAIGVPLIVYWQRRYQKKLASGKRISDLVELKS
jgi:hypothetical protein